MKASFTKAAAVCALLALLAPAPARAQFFPFFDTRPPPPVAAPQPQRPVRAKPKKPHGKAAAERRHPATVKAEPPPAPQAAVEGPPPPYEPQMLRLSEIMGALAALDPLCGGSGGQDSAGQSSAGPGDTAWRESMQKLMDAQDAGPKQRERLAGAYNLGLRGYEYFHRTCTPSADLARRRLLDEGGRLASEIATRYQNR
jgi:uncharacterized protein (TIGR02301 family)